MFILPWFYYITTDVELRNAFFFSITWSYFNVLQKWREYRNMQVWVIDDTLLQCVYISRHYRVFFFPLRLNNSFALLYKVLSSWDNSLYWFVDSCTSYHLHPLCLGKPKELYFCCSCASCSPWTLSIWELDMTSSSMTWYT